MQKAIQILCYFIIGVPLAIFLYCLSAIFYPIAAILKPKKQK